MSEKIKITTERIACQRCTAEGRMLVYGQCIDCWREIQDINTDLQAKTIALESRLADLERERDLAKTEFAFHRKVVGRFLSDMHAVMVDPCFEGKISTAEMVGILLKAAKDQRQREAALTASAAMIPERVKAKAVTVARDFMHMGINSRYDADDIADAIEHLDVSAIIAQAGNVMEDE